MTISKQNKSRFLAILLGLGVLLIAEGALRLSGAYEESPGDPFIGFTSVGRLFVEKDKGYITNPNRLHLFNLQGFAKTKAENVKRIFCLGGSVIKGFPFGMETSLPGWLQFGLNNLDNETRYEVINAGGFAYASYRVRLVAKEIVENYEPDLLVIMSGHNEFLEKRIYSEELLKGPMPSTRKSLRSLRLFNMLRTLLIKGGQETSKPVLGEDVSWDFVQRGDAQKKLTAMHYKANLEYMASLGVPVIFVNLPVNLADWAPYNSSHKPELSADDLNKFDNLMEQGKKFLEDGDYDKAAGEFQQAVDIDDKFAEANFMLGRAYLGTGKYDKAKKHFQLAVDTDDHPVRGYSYYNDIIREVVQAKGALYADARSSVNQMSRNGIPGYDAFVDHCHPVPVASAGMAFAVLQTGNKAGMFSMEKDWHAGYQNLASLRVRAIEPKYMAEGYYAAGYEAGRYMKRPVDAKRCFELSLKYDPNLVKSKEALEKWTQ